MGGVLKGPEAYEAIKELIRGKKLVPGQKIIYRDLEEMLGMSKTPIINGLVRLEEEGLVVSKKNRGFYIKEESLLEAGQIFDLREKLEQISLEFAIANYSKQGLAILKEKMIAYHEYETPIYDRKKLELDTDFHQQIAKMGGNQYFAKMICRFYESVFFNLNLSYFLPYTKEFSVQHELLYEAVKNKNLEEAKTILLRHFRAARKLFYEKKDPGL
jgi:DNA-binding GntR family transcriptional regulator